MSAVDWKQLAGPLAKAGAGALGTILGGPAGGAIGAGVGGILAEALGVPADPKSVAEAIEEKPDVAREALASRDADISAIIAKANADIITTINETMRLEQKSESWFVRGWRPACGWMLCLVWGVHGLAIGIALIRRDFEVIRTIDSLTIFYSVMGAICGVAAYGRTREKLAGVNGPSVGGIIGAALGKVIRK
jgi:outer membrane lipoprotein SlyB